MSCASAGSASSSIRLVVLVTSSLPAGGHSRPHSYSLYMVSSQSEQNWLTLYCIDRPNVVLEKPTHGRLSCLFVQCTCEPTIEDCHYLHTAEVLE